MILEYPWRRKKTTDPATKVTYLGIELDCVARVARLPMDKITENVHLLNHFLSESKIRKSQLDSLIGKLCFASSVVPARPFLRSLYDLALTTQVPYHFVKLTKSAKADLQIWLEFLSSYNGVTFFRHSHIVPSHEINMYADASSLGFGATVGPGQVARVMEKIPHHSTGIFPHFCTGFTFSKDGLLTPTSYFIVTTSQLLKS